MYASVGAAYGSSLLWALALITVSLAVVQEMAGRLGAVTGKGFADVVRENFVELTCFRGHPIVGQSDCPQRRVRAKTRPPYPPEFRREA